MNILLPITERSLWSVFTFVIVIPKWIWGQHWSFLVLALKPETFCDVECKISWKSSRNWGILHINWRRSPLIWTKIAEKQNTHTQERARMCKKCPFLQMQSSPKTGFLLIIWVLFIIFESDFLMIKELRSVCSVLCIC